MSYQTGRRTRNPKPFDRIFVPKTTTDMTVVKQIYSILKGTNVDEMLRELRKLNVSLDLANEDGDTPLHVVLDNEASVISKNDMYRLVKILIDEFSATTNKRNNRRITPLHLACKYQHPKIVKLMVYMGDDVAASDNSHMCPLHYAVQGNIVICKKKKKVGALIPKQAVLDIGSRDVFVDEMKKLTITIIDILQSPAYNQHLVHISRSMDNVGSMYKKEFKEFYKEFVAATMKTSRDPKETHISKSIKTSEYLRDMKSKMQQHVEKELRLALDEMTIKPNQSDGWGPGKEPANRVLEKSSFKILHDFRYNFTINYNIVKNSFQGIGTQFRETIRHLQGYITNINSGDERIFDHWYNIEVNASYENPMSAEDIRNTLDIQNFEYYENLYEEKNNHIYLFFDSPFDPDVERISRDMPTYHLMTEDQKKEGDKKDLRQLQLTDNRAFDPDKKMGTRLWGRSLDIINEKVGRDFAKHYKTEGNRLTKEKRDETLGIKDKKYSITSIMKNHINHVIDYIERIEDEIKRLSDEDVPEIYIDAYQHSVILIQVYLLNIEIHMNRTVKLLDNITNNYDAIVLKYTTRETQYMYSLENIRVGASDAIKGVDDIRKHFVPLHEKVITTQQAINSFITHMNNISAFRFIDTYQVEHRDDAPSSFYDARIYIMQDIFDQNLQHLIEFPADLEEFRSTLSTLDNQDWADIARKYLPTISTDYYPTYHTVNADRIADENIEYSFGNSLISYAEEWPYDIRPRSGFIIPDRNIYNDTFRVFEHFLIKDKEGDGLYEKKDGTIEPFSKVTELGIEDKVILLPSYRYPENPEFFKPFGHPGLASFSQGDLIKFKIDAPFPSIRNYLGEHVKIIKNNIIEQLISLIHHFAVEATTKKASDDDEDIVKSIRNIYGKIKNFHKDTYKMPPELVDGITLSIVGGVADQLIRLHIAGSIQNGVIHYINKIGDPTYMGKTSIRPIENILAEKNVSVILKDKINFELNFSKLFEKILEQYTDYELKLELDVPKYSNIVMKTTDKLYEEEYKGSDPKYPKKNELGQYELHNTGYTATLFVASKDCYELEPEIIDYLIDGTRLDIDLKDIAGFTALFYAIQLQNTDIINKLISKGASVSLYKVMNKNMKTPLLFAKDKYIAHLETLHNPVFTKETAIKGIINKLCLDSYTKVKDKMGQKEAYANNHIEYLDIIFPQLLIMYNNVFALHMKNYINEWDYKNYKDLKSLLVGEAERDNPDTNIGMALLDDENMADLHKKMHYVDVLYSKKGQLDKKYEKSVKEFTSIVHSMDNIIQELLGIGGSHLSVDDITAKNKKIKDDTIELEEKYGDDSELLSKTAKNVRIVCNDIYNVILHNIVAAKGSIDVNKMNALNLLLGRYSKLCKKMLEVNWPSGTKDKNIKKHIKNYRTKNLVKHTRHLSKRDNKLRTKLWNSVAEIYDEIFDSLFDIKSMITKDTDYNAYNALWRAYIQNGKLINSFDNVLLLTNISEHGSATEIDYDSIYRYDHRKLNDPDRLDDADKFRNLESKFEIIRTLYDKIVRPQIKNYYELSQEYMSKYMDENVMLKEIYLIIKHIVTQTLCSSLYHAIIRCVTTYLSASLPGGLTELKYDIQEEQYDHPDDKSDMDERKWIEREITKVRREQTRAKDNINNIKDRIMDRNVRDSLVGLEELDEQTISDMQGHIRRIYNIIEDPDKSTKDNIDNAIKSFYEKNNKDIPQYIDENGGRIIMESIEEMKEEEELIALVNKIADLDEDINELTADKDRIDAKLLAQKKVRIDKRKADSKDRDEKQTDRRKKQREAREKEWVSGEEGFEFDEQIHQTAKDVMSAKDNYLENYIIKDLPEKLVKFLLRIYDDEYDGNKKLSSLDEILEPITKTLMDSDKVTITKESSLIENIDKYVFPYYIDLFAVSIPQMKLLIDNYNRYLLNSADHAEIMHILLKKTAEERYYVQ